MRRTILTALVGLWLSSVPIAVYAQPIPDVPARCYDASIRFPATHDPYRAVDQAILDNGGNPYNRANPFVQNYREASPRIVLGWVAVSLLKEGRGQAAPTLAQWMKEGNTLGWTMAATEWDEMLSWPAESCEGAFMKNPDNALLVQFIGTYLVRKR
jgi:hypothetical protein